MKHVFVWPRAAEVCWFNHSHLDHVDPIPVQSSSKKRQPFCAIAIYLTTQPSLIYPIQVCMSIIISLSIYLSIHLSIYLSIYTHIMRIYVNINTCSFFICHCIALYSWQILLPGPWYIITVSSQGMQMVLFWPSSSLKSTGSSFEQMVAVGSNCHPVTCEFI